MEIKSITDYLGHVQSFEQQHIVQWFFRGVRDADYELIPSLFRIDINSTLTNWNDCFEWCTDKVELFNQTFKEYTNN